MSEQSDWRAELEGIVQLMREISRQTDPQVAGNLYFEGLGKGHLPIKAADRWISVSRRDLSAPAYRITRSSTWDEDINPWLQRDKLPLLQGGLLAELVYSNEPVLIQDLTARLKSDDPAYEYLRDMRMLLTLPQFDNGESINVSILLMSDGTTFPIDRWPIMVWNANLYGRATLNLVLRQQLQAAYESLDREMEVVAEMQRSLLPRELPPIPTLEMAVHYQTSRRAGGDYYDFFPLPNGKWGLFLADVSGHGTPAAVVMAITHAIAHSYPSPTLPPDEVLNYVNERLTTRYTGESGTFVTALYAVYDPATREFACACAGHHMPRLRRDGRVSGLRGPAGLPLGIDPDERYEASITRLAPGDVLALYTDGFTEAFDSGRDMFGTERLDQALAAPGLGAAGLLGNVLSAVDGFTMGKPPTDDRTLLVIRVD